MPKAQINKTNCFPESLRSTLIPETRKNYIAPSHFLGSWPADSRLSLLHTLRKQPPAMHSPPPPQNPAEYNMLAQAPPLHLGHNGRLLLDKVVSIAAPVRSFHVSRKNFSCLFSLLTFITGYLTGHSHPREVRRAPL